jgi:hypothetical protein
VRRSVLPQRFPPPHSAHLIRGLPRLFLSSASNAHRMMDVHRAVNDANLPDSADLPGYHISGESDPGHRGQKVRACRAQRIARVVMSMPSGMRWKHAGNVTTALRTWARTSTSMTTRKCAAACPGLSVRCVGKGSA